ncbi:6-aminohexanoate-dimer hydrolase [Paenibacillus solanacearum]|uniref:6-aminohexanoate-dimer hydrolase n=1 Tax=Paenibacillus solanacearum TaxID=2048548 RepID=A0A916JXB9_9BACL|nr:serine hydrolase [Paenibacillus solanacearum]CAG7607921.1 6-aminohexanoate-dimer hydrolase [Paenibacillus solanacearum]
MTKEAFPIIADALPRASYFKQIYMSMALDRFVRSVETAQLNLHSLMIVHHGEVVAEKWWPPHQSHEPHELFSISKCFCSTAVGMAVEDGLLSVHDRVISFFPSCQSPAIEQNMGSLRISHLLTMSIGHAKDPTNQIVRHTEDGDWVKAFLETPLKDPPGSKFVYNNAAGYMLSAILQTVTGESLLDYLRPRLFEPLGMERVSWDTCPKGINTGGWGLSLTTEDIAKFGQLYLCKGNWNGRQLLSEKWIDTATSQQISTLTMNGLDKRLGYGYMFWRCRHGGFCGRGAEGQFCIVLPKKDAVIVIMAEEKRMQAILDLVWVQLLPALV